MIPVALTSGATTASGPPAARFATGITSVAQPELNGPTTPSTRRLAAYVFAFDAHFSGSKIPVWAVESSHDW